MIDYFELSIAPEPFFPWSEVLVAKLADLGFESFTEDNGILRAYIPSNILSQVPWEILLDDIRNQGVKLTSELNRIPGQNWNQTWEEQYEPVDLGNLMILAPFHTELPANKKIIRILPKMSFGTGHHQTTAMMCQAMDGITFKETKVLDFGCGTGILAIYAEMLGASEILAIDIEPWSVENTKENMAENNCIRGRVEVGRIEDIKDSNFDRVLANINRNVLIPSFAYFNSLMSPQSRLLLSGFFVSDVDDLIAIAEKYQFNLIASYENSSWACLDFIKG